MHFTAIVGAASVATCNSIHAARRSPECSTGRVQLQIAAALDLLGDMGQDVLRPFFGGIERRNAHLNIRLA
jgi:hypothetical protein